MGLLEIAVFSLTLVLIVFVLMGCFLLFKGIRLLTKAKRTVEVRLNKLKAFSGIVGTANDLRILIRKYSKGNK